MKNVQRVKLYWILTQNQIFKNYLMKHYVIWYEKQKLFILIFIRVEIFIFKIVTISIYIHLFTPRGVSVNIFVDVRRERTILSKVFLAIFKQIHLLTSL